MELVYLWVEDYKNIHKQGFNFSPRFTCKYNKESNELEKSFWFSQDKIYHYLFSNYSKDEDLHKRPLSKLIKDISKELELIQ